MAARDTRVALIRGINVGKAKRVAMAELRAAVEGLGYGDVRTLLNSGNVVFTVPAKGKGAESKGEPAARIEGVLAQGLRVPARVVVLTAAELAEAVDGNPLLDRMADPSRFLVAGLAPAADRARLAPLLAQDWAPDALAVSKRVAYLWCADGILASRLLLAFNRATGEDATTRNWTTMTKLRALAESG